MTLIEIPTTALGDLLRRMFGPAPLSPKPSEAMRWEDDGGPLDDRCEEWEHVLVAVDVSVPAPDMVAWRPVYR